MRVDIASTAASQVHDTTSNIAEHHPTLSGEMGREVAHLAPTHQQGESSVGVCMYMYVWSS